MEIWGEKHSNQREQQVQRPWGRTMTSVRWGVSGSIPSNWSATWYTIVLNKYGRMEEKPRGRLYSQTAFLLVLQDSDSALNPT